MSLILNIVINFFNKRENISLGFLIYLLYLNNYSLNQIMFLVFGPPDFKFLAPPLTPRILFTYRYVSKNVVTSSKILKWF